MRTSPIRKVSLLALLLAPLLATVACTHYYTPQQYPIAATLIAPFANQPAVTLRNVAPTGPVIVGAQSGHKWIGDYHAWTDVAITLAADELGKRAVTTVAEGKKTLKLSITRANLFWGFGAIRCILNLHVESGDGWTRDFEGNNVSPWTLERSIDGAVTRAVQAMLEDNGVRVYLEAP